MTAHRYVPHPPLSDFVELFWAYDAYGEGRARERVLPSGTCELVIDLSEATGAPIVCGAHSEAFVIDVATRPALITARRILSTIPGVYGADPGRVPPSVSPGARARGAPGLRSVFSNTVPPSGGMLRP